MAGPPAWMMVSRGRGRHLLEPADEGGHGVGRSVSGGRRGVEADTDLVDPSPVAAAGVGEEVLPGVIDAHARLERFAGDDAGGAGVPERRLVDHRFEGCVPWW